MMDNHKPSSAHTDRIYINDLLIRCIIGINAWERTQKQDVLINITLYADLQKASQTDSLEDSVDYRDIKKQIIALVENSSFFLVERLAGGIAQLCLGHLSVKAVRVRVDKPGALRYAKSVGVEIFRTQPDA